MIRLSRHTVKPHLQFIPYKITHKYDTIQKFHIDHIDRTRARARAAQLKLLRNINAIINSALIGQ